MTFIESFIYLSIILTSVGGFLLDGNAPNGQKQYLSLSEFYDNKNQQQHDTDVLRHETEEIRHKMEQMKSDNAKTLALLTSQLQQKFSDIQNNITTASQHNETARLVEVWEHKYHDLQGHNKKIQQKFNALQIQYIALKNEMNLRPTTQEIDIQQEKNHNVSKELFSMAEKELVSLKTKTVVLENKIDTINQLKAIQQLQDLHSMHDRIQEISTRIHSLGVNEQARNQDFLALYNLTTIYGKKLQDLEIQSRNHLKQHANDQNETNDVQNKILKQILTSKMKIETVENTIRERFAFENCSCFANTSERVTFTACVQPSLPFNTEIIKFNSIKVHVGIKSLRSFIFFGLFTCEKPGLYLVDVSVISNAYGSLYSIRKNGTTVVQSDVSKDSRYESASLVAAVELNVGDTIDIYADNNVYSLALGSCVTIVKIS